MSRATVSSQARADLKDIWNYIAERDVQAADRVLADLREAIGKVARMPGIGHPRREVADKRFRFWTVRSYLIAYYPDTKPIEIVRVVHGARNFKKLFNRK
ncbi:MAG TPA: type II toxin-antitoxin system RelE/ParE family toxin [Tepidisphaeraceae bacterium]|nr:type II toxin-antitoxin system RelE/ParE family toxin [Tepidisphaeraceae bacterium]